MLDTPNIAISGFMSFWSARISRRHLHKALNEAKMAEINIKKVMEKKERLSEAFRA